MYKNISKDCHELQDPVPSPLIEENSNKCSMIDQQQLSIQDENTQILIDTDNEEEFTSSGISEDEEEDEENNFDEGEGQVLNQSKSERNFMGNILQPSYQCHHRTSILNTTQNWNITFIQAERVTEATQMNNDHLIAQTMAVLAAKHRHTKPVNSTLTEHDILSFIGPCPLYSLASSFGLDMHHGLSYFPCRNVLANGGGHIPAPPLWHHLTSYHNLNLSSSSLLISHLLLHGYSSPSPILFNSQNTKNILRTTPRYSLIKTCPLTTYGVYGIQFEHGTRLCSGYTYNTNIYLHLISFHKMTDDAALRLSRAIAFYDKQFQFQLNEIIVNESIKCSLVKFCQIRKIPRLKTNQCHLVKKILPKKPVKNSSN